MSGRDDDKPVKPGQIKPSIPDHNLDPRHGTGWHSGSSSITGPGLPSPAAPTSGEGPKQAPERSTGDAAERSEAAGQPVPAARRAVRDRVEKDDPTDGRNRPFPAGLLLVPLTLGLLVAAFGDTIARRNGLEDPLAAIGIAVGGGVVATASVFIMTARMPAEESRIVGPIGLALATIAVASTLLRVV